MKRTALRIGVFALAAAAGYSLPQRAPTSSARAITPPTSSARDGTHFAPGSAPIMVASFEPLATSTHGRRESLTARLVIRNGAAAQARFRTAIELVDDRGHALQAPQLSAVGRVDAGRDAETAVTSTPANLADGFYQMRATAATLAGDDEALAVAQLYFEVSGGAVHILDAEEWMARSNANAAVRL